MKELKGDDIMRDYINFIKNDFISVREALNYIFKRNIPLWIYIPYYVIVGVILTPVFVILLFVYKIRIWRFNKWRDEA